jgi:hypothetical protein
MPIHLLLLLAALLLSACQCPSTTSRSPSSPVSMRSLQIGTKTDFRKGTIEWHNADDFTLYTYEVKNYVVVSAVRNPDVPDPVQTKR